MSISQNNPNERFPVHADMEKNPTWIAVVAAALVRPDGRVLMQCRPPEKQHGGLWEFPGGKVEKDEFPPIALAREIEEELGITLDAGNFWPSGFAQSEAHSGGPAIVILLYTARNWRGVPQPLEGGELGWFTFQEAAALAKPPLDISLLEGLIAAG